MQITIIFKCFTPRAVQVIRNQGGGSPPDLTIFANWGGGGGEFFSKIMTHFGLIKLESSNLLDITIIDGYIVLHITNLQNMAYIVGCKIVIKSCPVPMP